MSFKAQCILGIILLFVLALIINMVRKRKLELKYVLAWMICDIALLILVFVPGLMTWLAEILGIYSPVNMVFFLGFVFSLLIIFSLTVALSRVTAKVRRLAQILALESRIREEEEQEN